MNIGQVSAMCMIEGSCLAAAQHEEIKIWKAEAEMQQAKYRGLLAEAQKSAVEIKRRTRIELLTDLRRLVPHAASVEVVDHILLGMLTLEKCELDEQGQRK